MPEPALLVDGLLFPEAPRWHEGRFWVSDMQAGRVLAVALDGEVSVVATAPPRLSGLGFLPDGRLLVVSMIDRRLLVSRRPATPEGTSELNLYADLSELAPFHCNDLVVDAGGRAYVGSFGYDPYAGEAPRPTSLVLVDVDRAARAVAGDLHFPNGMAITPDGATLLVAESGANRITAFAVSDDGSLGRRRTWADLDVSPDGLCLDADGCVWVAAPTRPTGCFLRVAEGGVVHERIVLADRRAFACMLGGPDGHTLLLCEAKKSSRDGIEGPGNGRLRTVRAPAGRAGYP